MSPQPAKANEETPPEVLPRTLAQALLRAGAHPRGQSEGLRFVDRRERARHHPWIELVARAKRVATELRAAGVEAGEAVPLVFGTGPEFFDAFFGLTLCGAVPAPLYPPLRLGHADDYATRTAPMMAAVEARFVLVSSSLRARLQPIAEAAGAQLLDLPATPASSEELVLDPETEGARFDVRQPEDTALVQFSSGSTGDPRPVALSNAALLAQAERIGEILPDDPATGLRQSGVSWLPLYHDMGLIGCVVPAFWRPAELTLIAPEVFVARPALWLRTLSRYRATVSAAPTFAFNLCLERLDVEGPELAGLDLSAWHAALVGAETVVPSVLQRFAERFARFGFESRALTPVYGLAEASLAVTTTPIDREVVSVEFDRRALIEEGKAVVQGPEGNARDDETPLELVALGRPLPDFDVEIRDDSGNPLPAGHLGRVWARGPSLMQGYLGQPAATAKVLREGWLDTGDRGFLLDSELYLTGRAKDVLVVNGRNYSPEPIETAVSEIEGLTGVVASSRAEAGDASERLLLFVERRRRGPNEDSALDEELAGQCRARALTNSGLVCAAVVLVDSGRLPRTSSGKVRRGETLRRYVEGRLADTVEVRS